MPLRETSSDAERLRTTARRFLAAGVLDRSVPLRRLFDFLLDSTLAGRTPREIDVAQDVFGRTSGFDVGQDATIRVNVHRLRRKLEEFRLAFPDDITFLAIPRGEYRLALSQAAPQEIEPEPEPVELAVAPPIAWPHRHRGLLVLAALLLLVNIGGWALVALGDRPPAAVRSVGRTAFWAPLAQSASPTVIVVGDYYIFGEAPGAAGVTRLVREFAINSRDDLDQYLMMHPEQAGRLVDLDLHYLPVGAAAALRSLVPVIEGLGSRGRVRVITMSQLTPDILKNANIVYVGYLSGLGLLRDVVFHSSSLAVGDSYDELVDSRSGRHFSSDWGEVASGRTPQRDYGYLASVALPGGKRLLVVAGTRDAALMQSAESAVDPAQLKEIGRRTQDAPAAEALLEVSTMGNAALAGKLVLARAMAASTRPAPGQQAVFPDDVRSRHRVRQRGKAVTPATAG